MFFLIFSSSKHENKPPDRIGAVREKRLCLLESQGVQRDNEARKSHVQVRQFVRRPKATRRRNQQGKFLGIFAHIHSND